MAIRTWLTPIFPAEHAAPALIAICATSDEPFVAYDCCLAAENLMLAAHARDLGTCWIGLSETWLNEPDGKEMTGIPANYRVIAPIVVGHPRMPPPPTTRRAPVITWID